MRTKNNKPLCLAFIIVCALWGSQAFAGVASLQWANDKVAPLPDSLKKKPLVAEFRHITQTILIETNNAFVREVLHTRYYLNTSESLEDQKNMYFAYSEAGRPDVKIRVIRQDGSIVITDKKFFTDVTEEGISAVKVAIQGLEVGCSLELITDTKEDNVKYFSQSVSATYPILDFKFKFTHLSLFTFTGKLYNTPLTLDKAEVGDSTVYSVNAKYIKETPREIYQVYADAQARLVFLFIMPNSSKMEYSWQGIANTIINGVTTADKKGKAAAEKFAKKAIGKETDEAAQIRLLELAIKNNIYQDKTVPYSGIDKTISNKYGSEFSVLQLYAACLKALNINYSLVLTKDRRNGRFDADFPNVYQFQTIMFYFPRHELYIVPGYKYFYAGSAPDDFANQQGLFVKPVVVNDVTTGVISMKTIGFDPVQKNMDTNTTHATIDVASLKVSAQAHNLSTGGQGTMRRVTYLSAEKPEDKIARTEQFLNGEQKNLTVKAQEFTNFTYDPLKPALPAIMDITLQSDKMVYQAGNELIVHMGWLLGSQAMIPAQEKRQTPVFTGSMAHGYRRHITLKIPAGYKVTGLEKLNKTISHLDGKLYFKTTFSQQGDEIVLDNEEMYNVIDLPATDFGKYEEVINAAAYLYNQDIVLVKK